MNNPLFLTNLSSHDNMVLGHDQFSKPLGPVICNQFVGSNYGLHQNQLQQQYAQQYTQQMPPCNPSINEIKRSSDANSVISVIKCSEKATGEQMVNNQNDAGIDGVQVIYDDDYNQEHNSDATSNEGNDGISIVYGDVAWKVPVTPDDDMWGPITHDIVTQSGEAVV